jgi:ParB family chromosome partitioning protein
MAGGQLLDGKRESLFRVDPETLTIIGLDTKDGSEHPLWDERIKLPLDEAMILNIMALGVREPVVVVVQGRGEDKLAAVVDGRRRVMHAREANRRLAARGEPKTQVPVIAEKGMSESEQMLLSASLNEIRLDDPVMTKAAKAARMKARGSSIQDIALSFGVDGQTITLWVSINGLTDVVKKAINDGRLRPTAAGALAGLTPEKQKETLTELLAESAVSGKKPTVDQVKGRVKAKKSGVDGSPPSEVPQRRVLRRVVENGTEVLSEDFLKGVRFAIGELNPKTVKGLTALMEKKPAAAEKKPAADAAE